MVNKCVAAGCSNTSSSSITLFKFPKDPKLRYEWEKQVLCTIDVSDDLSRSGSSCSNEEQEQERLSGLDVSLSSSIDPSL